MIFNGLFEFRKTGKDAITEPGLRRDLYIWVNEFLVFFGEAKPEAEGLQKAEQELVTKTRACIFLTLFPLLVIFPFYVLILILRFR